MDTGEDKRSNLSVAIQKTVKKMKANWYEYKLNMILDDFEVAVADNNAGSIARETLLSDECRVAVVGEFKRGKSSVINALLGEDILPTFLNPWTAVKTEVQFSQDEEAILTFTNGEHRVIPFSELQDWLTKKNENSNLIEQALVRYPSDFLMDTGVILMDTPGLNDDGVLDERTFAAMWHIDMLLWVLSPDSPFSNSEAAYLKRMVIEANIHSVLFVINRIDFVEEEDRPLLLDTMRNRIHNVMAEVLSVEELKADGYGNIVLFSARDALSARKKENPLLLQNSGFFTLLSMMELGIKRALYWKKHRKLPNAIKEQIGNTIANLNDQAATHSNEGARQHVFANRFRDLSSVFSEYPIETKARMIAIEQRKQILNLNSTLFQEFQKSIVIKGMDTFLACIKAANDIGNLSLRSTRVSEGIDKLKDYSRACMDNFTTSYVRLAEEAAITQQGPLFTEDWLPESRYLPEFSFSAIDFPLLMFKRNPSARKDYIYPVVEKKISRIAYSWEEAVQRWIKEVFADIARQGQERIDCSVQILEQRSLSEKQLADKILREKQYSDLQRLLTDIESLHAENVYMEQRSFSERQHSDEVLQRGLFSDLLRVLIGIKSQRTKDVNDV